jgi:TPP-dependent indolepyruvate ferredoxin oxidoreductase alpha subunit
MSVLEHEWIIILDAKNAHDIESLCIATGISSISTVKIVPMNDFHEVIKRIRSQSH